MKRGKRQEKNLPPQLATVNLQAAGYQLLPTPHTTGSVTSASMHLR